MATQVLYINESYLKLNTNLSQNLDGNLIRPTMIKAQDIYISSFLGTTLDAQLKDHILNNTLTTLEQELLVYIKKAQVEFTAYLTYVDILFRWMNKSATTPSVENGTNISRADMIYVRDIAKNQGEFYLNEVRQFLHLNKDTFTSMANKGQWGWGSITTFTSPFIYDRPRCGCNGRCNCGFNYNGFRNGYNFD